MNNKTSNTIKKKSKTQSSLVLKLNAGMLWRLVLAFISINVLIIILSFFLIFWKVEEGAYIITSEIIDYKENQIHLNINNYEIFETKELSLIEGFKLPNLAEKIFPLKFKNAKRSINFYKSKEDMKLLDKLDLAEYGVKTKINGRYYQIKYSLGSELRLFFFLFLMILFFQLLIIIGNLRKGTRRIRKTLKPLSDLAETARSLNEEILSKGAMSEKQHLEDLAGIISNIDANKLDSRISVESSQNELKDLASAINDMLNRLNDSYQSQIRFVSDASHELRTPISVIQGYANLLDRWGKNDEETMQESIDAIKGEAESMKELVEQLLFLARGDNETIQFNEEKIDVCEIMDEIVKETKMINCNHEFEVSLKRPAYISGDKQLIKQVIRILVDNSMKYTPPGGEIILKIESKDNFVNITVQDSGIGIDPGDLENTFDRFYRSDESRARKTGGSGLGLSIAKWIIEQHKGHFEILSRVNIGTRITIMIPELMKEDLIDL